ncbi:MAG TPA: hypothetical protein VL357_12005 [Rariglobus sp.]|jgi:hypothetical protein|nr:hypothetical protein [Rariglobus sp.]
MTAHEVIDQIKALGPNERAKVLDFVHALDSAKTPMPHADDRAFEEARKWVFEEHADLMRKLSQ